MHKKIIISILFLVTILFNSICYAVDSTNTKNNKTYQVIIEDDANLLTQDEKEMLYTTMEKLTEYGNILFKTIDKNPFSLTSKYASTYYYEKCKNQSGTVFLIDMDNRIIYIYSDGNNYKTITTEKAEVITDNIYQYATNKQYYKCATEAFSQIYTLLQGGKIAEPMKYISNGVMAVMLALLANFAIFKVATRNKVASSNEQIEECEIFFEHTKPETTKTGQHRVYSPISDSSSGGRKQRWWRPVAAGGGRRWPVAVAIVFKRL